MMERLTQRDRKGLAWFDNDGVLIRGANGAFHLKRDMTAHFIHDRFVALDKALARLAAYEDTGLEPKEVEALAAAQANVPLTLDELREMDGQPVWIRADYYGIYADVVHVLEHKDGDRFVSFKINYRLQENGYGKTWMAYHRKPEEGTS